MNSKFNVHGFSALSSKRFQLWHTCEKPQPPLFDLCSGTKENCEIPKSTLELNKKLGSGQFSEVSKGVYTSFIFHAHVNTLSLLQLIVKQYFTIYKRQT